MSSIEAQTQPEFIIVSGDENPFGGDNQKEAVDEPIVSGGKSDADSLVDESEVVLQEADTHNVGTDADRPEDGGQIKTVSEANFVTADYFNRKLRSLNSNMIKRDKNLMMSLSDRFSKSHSTGKEVVDTPEEEDSTKTVGGTNFVTADYFNRILRSLNSSMITRDKNLMRTMVERLSDSNQMSKTVTDTLIDDAYANYLVSNHVLERQDHTNTELDALYKDLNDEFTRIQVQNELLMQRYAELEVESEHLRKDNVNMNKHITTQYKVLRLMEKRLSYLEEQRDKDLDAMNEMTGTLNEILDKDMVVRDTLNNKFKNYDRAIFDLRNQHQNNNNTNVGISPVSAPYSRNNNEMYPQSQRTQMYKW